MSVTANASPARETLLRRATTAAVAVAVFLILIKLFAFYTTQAVSLLSSLIDSLMDMCASLINLFAVRQALVPADNEHRFGHGKVEPLAGLAQAAFITGSSLFLCFEAVRRLLHPVTVEHGTVGILVMLISLVVTIGLVTYQRHVIRQTGSLAVGADSIHYASDVAMNLGVIVALVLTVNFGWVYADPLFAIGIAAYILYSVALIARRSLDQLMDRELPEPDRDKIINLAQAHPGVRNVHDLRTRASGYHRFIQLHLEVDGSLDLAQAHQIAVDVQTSIEVAFPEADVIIHEDPV